MKPAAMKMLIVEDDSMIGKLVQDYFAADHPEYEFVFAVDGVEAIEKAKAELPDIIITDLMLPMIPGTEVISELRKLDEFAVTPIVVITAGSMMLHAEAMAAGASLVISKPFRKSELISKVDALVGANPYVRKRPSKDPSSESGEGEPLGR
jgi:DNA-binding response OmpR family regulator